MTRAQEPLAHAERLALWHQPIRIRRRRRPWWPRVAVFAVVVALLGMGVSALLQQPQAVVAGRMR